MSALTVIIYFRQLFATPAPPQVRGGGGDYEILLKRMFTFRSLLCRCIFLILQTLFVPFMLPCFFRDKKSAGFGHRNEQAGHGRILFVFLEQLLAEVASATEASWRHVIFQSLLCVAGSVCARHEPDFIK